MLFFLIGYMGSGKSLIGKSVAEKLKMNFLDIDVLIEEQEQKSVAKIFEENGEAYFRDIEQKMLKNTMSMQINSVVSTGGGTACFFDNIQWMNKNGISFYLKTEPNVIYHRIKNTDRPLLANISNEDNIAFIKKHIKQRELFYNQANYIIDTLDISPDAITDKICSIIEKHK